jgi:hypothetical protein
MTRISLLAHTRQSTLFHFVTRALFAIPGATIHSFYDILKNGAAKYQRFIVPEIPR